MEFTTHDDIKAPIDFVFDQVTDFAAFERSIMRRGGEVERISGGDSAAIGTKWRVNFILRGAERLVTAEVVAIDRPNAMTIEITSASADATVNIDLVALSRTHTRLNVAVAGKAKTIPAKLLFQSVRFARNKTKARFKGVVSNFAKEVEARHRG